jgi:hypothetical protein
VSSTTASSDQLAEINKIKDDKNSKAWDHTFNNQIITKYQRKDQMLIQHKNLTRNISLQPVDGYEIILLHSKPRNSQSKENQFQFGPILIYCVLVNNKQKEQYNLNWYGKASAKILKHTSRAVISIRGVTIRLRSKDN